MTGIGLLASDYWHRITGIGLLALDYWRRITGIAVCGSLSRDGAQPSGDTQHLRVRLVRIGRN